jgi:hypothetical protein
MTSSQFFHGQKAAVRPAQVDSQHIVITAHVFFVTIRTELFYNATSRYAINPDQSLLTNYQSL